MSEYRAAWDRWAAEQDALPVPLSVDTRIMKLQMLGQAAVLTHSIDSREGTDAGEEAAHEVETIVFGKIARRSLADRPSAPVTSRRLSLASDVDRD